MTENFIIAAFRKMGEDPTTVRLMRNKYTGEPAGYCFVNFISDDHALDAMHRRIVIEAEVFIGRNAD